MRQLRKFLQMTADQRQLLIYTFLLLGLVRLGMWLLPFRVLEKFLAKLGKVSKLSRFRFTHPQTSSMEVDRIVDAVSRSSWYMPGTVKCLARSLTTEVLMNQYGYAPVLQIGVAKDEQGQLKAHAWIENKGQVVIGHLEDLSRYRPMSSL